MRVLKFGGTSVADAAAIERAVAIVNARPGPRTVVVSALAGVTDALLTIASIAAQDTTAALSAVFALTARHHQVASAVRARPARQILDAAIDDIGRGAGHAVHAMASGGDISAASCDRLVAAGELWSSRMVAAFLADAGIPTQWLDARDVVRTNARHGDAAPDMDATRDAVTRLVRPALALDRVVVVAGFIGSGLDGTTTLGRGGSDYSAAVIGACLDADCIEIWTDVDGVLSADPRVVPGARVLPTLSYEDAAMLARFGAKVLHPKTLEPAAARGIPVRVLNSRNPGHAGTRIDAGGADGQGYAAVASRNGVTLVQIRARDDDAEGSFAARALVALSDAGGRIVLGEMDGDRLHVAVERPFDLESFRTRVAPFADVRTRDGLAAICAVGERLAGAPGYVAGALDALIEGPLHLVSRSVGCQAVAVIVDDDEAHAVVARLHDWVTTAPAAPGQVAR
jgi:aspartate kinase